MGHILVYRRNATWTQPKKKKIINNIRTKNFGKAGQFQGHQTCCLAFDSYKKPPIPFYALLLQTLFLPPKRSQLFFTQSWLSHVAALNLYIHTHMHSFQEHIKYSSHPWWWWLTHYKWFEHVVKRRSAGKKSSPRRKKGFLHRRYNSFFFILGTLAIPYNYRWILSHFFCIIFDIENFTSFFFYFRLAASFQQLCEIERIEREKKIIYANDMMSYNF